MRSPGFTGESAIYATARHYRTARTVSGGAPSLTAALSLPPRPGQRGRACLPGCICVTPEGCPCCDMAAPRQPTMLRTASMQLTCEPGQESMCQDWCDHAGGGMSSNPDGSTTCTVYAQL
jgi:hypothetical protein